MDYQSPQKCKHEGCNNKTKTDRWNKVRAAERGWFFQKDGSIWCPDHVPDWVASWRAKRNED